MGTKKIDYSLGDDIIFVNGVAVVLNDKIRDEQLHEYYIVDRESLIGELIGWISEATKDKEIMGLDLKMLILWEDEYILSSNETNDYLKKGMFEFDTICEEILNINKELK